MVNMNVSVTIYVVISLALIGALVFLLVKCENKGDGFCICSGMQNKACPDPNNLRRLYSEGKLTEYTLPGNAYDPGHQMPYDNFMRMQNQ